MFANYGGGATAPSASLRFYFETCGDNVYIIVVALAHTPAIADSDRHVSILTTPFFLSVRIKGMFFSFCQR